MPKMRPDRWENGSTFHWPDPRWPGLPMEADAKPMPWSSGLLLSSGRDALRLALANGMRERGWRRLWVPEYFCQTVTAALVRPGLELHPFRDNPLLSTPEWPDARAGDAILVMNYFGLRAPVAFPRRDGVEVIEDHSHDPTSRWARRSAADFCVASLRKTVPVSDGGALWSPRGHAIPAAPPVSAQRRRAAAWQLSAMILKAMYLEGLGVEKATYRELALRGEEWLGAAATCGISEVARAVLGSYPIGRWRRARGANFRVLRRRLAQVPWAEVLAPAGRGCVPSSCIVIADSETRRERVYHRLISARIYPAILWPLDETILEVGPEARDLSRRMLSIHCDGRYGPEDMRRVGDLVAGSGEA
jgi:hypothetical protein